MRRRLNRLARIALVATVAAGGARAQEALPQNPPVLTLDQERLFSGSAAAGRISDEIERRSVELAAENRQIESELSAEEQDLTLKRPDTDPAAFRALADAFDAKVQRIRDEQDAKERDLQRMREEERQRFLREITPVLAEIARERGALVVLDRRAVLLSADAIDITDAAILRIDQVFTEDDGTAPGTAPDAGPETAPDTAPETAPLDLSPAPVDPAPPPAPQ